jgi:hypothetical protein
MQTNVDLVGSVASDITGPCQICSEKIRHIYNVEQQYFIFLFVPLFPTKRQVYKICPKCNSRLKVRSYDPDFEWVNKSIPKRFNLRYYWGIFVLAGIAWLLWSWYKSVMSFNA